MTTTQAKSVTNITAIALQKSLAQKTVTLVDVREPGEYANERIPGAKLFSLSHFDPQKLPVEGGTSFVLSCQSGNRSNQAAQKLFAAGYKEVTHLEGGLKAWKQAGFPTEKTVNAPISIMRQVQIVAGSLVLTGVILGTFIAPGFYFLSGFVGAGLLFAGISGTCLMGNLLSKLSYNQVE